MGFSLVYLLYLWLTCLVCICLVVYTWCLFNCRSQVGGESELAANRDESVKPPEGVSTSHCQNILLNNKVDTFVFSVCKINSRPIDRFYQRNCLVYCEMNISRPICWRSELMQSLSQFKKISFCSSIIICPHYVYKLGLRKCHQTVFWCMHFQNEVINPIAYSTEK